MIFSFFIFRESHCSHNEHWLIAVSVIHEFSFETFYPVYNMVSFTKQKKRKEIRMIVSEARQQSLVKYSQKFDLVRLKIRNSCIAKIFLFKLRLKGYKSAD